MRYLRGWRFSQSFVKRGKAVAVVAHEARLAFHGVTGLALNVSHVIAVRVRFERRGLLGERFVRAVAAETGGVLIRRLESERGMTSGEFGRRRGGNVRRGGNGFGGDGRGYGVRIDGMRFVS